MVFQTNYKLATSWNNAAGLSTLEGTVPSSDIAFHVFKCYGSYSEGQEAFTGLGTLVFQGFPVVVWDWTDGYITPAQDTYLRSTYCGSVNKRSGLVTVRTIKGEITTLANYNAIMILPAHNTLTRDTSGRFTDYKITFSIRGTAS